MKIYIMATKLPDALGGESPWITGAWDEYTMDENPENFQTALKKEREGAGAENVGIGVIEVPDSFLDKLFLPRKTTALSAEPLENELDHLNLNGTSES